MKLGDEVTLVNRQGVPIGCVAWLGGYRLCRNLLCKDRGFGQVFYDLWRIQDGPPFVAYEAETRWDY